MAIAADGGKHRPYDTSNLNWYKSSNPHALREVWEWKEKASEEWLATPPEERTTRLIERTQPLVDEMLRRKKEKQQPN
jgi:DNA-directed RNA polymerase specialized sigma subunit